MNYLLQIVAFHRWKRVHPLPGNAIALWLELMAAWNEVAWERSFTISNAVLQAEAGLSRKEFEHARQLLISMGRITYQKSTRVNQAGVYTIIPIPIVQNGQREVHQEVQRQGQQEGHLEEHGRDIGRDNLYKPKLNDQDLDLNNNNNPPIIPLTAEQERDAMFRTLPLSHGDPEDFLAAYDDSNNAVLLPDTPSPEEEVPPCPADIPLASSSQHTPEMTSPGATARAG